MAARITFRRHTASTGAYCVPPNDAILDDFPVRGRQRPVTIPMADPDEATQEWLDDWRDYVRSTLDSSPTARIGARRALIALADRAGSHPGLAAAAAVTAWNRVRAMLIAQN